MTLLEEVNGYIATRKAREESISLLEAFERFLDSREDRSASYLSTIRKLKRKIPKKYLDIQVSDLTRKSVTNLLGEIANTPAQHNADRARLSSILGDAHKDGFSATNPVSDVRKLKETKGAPYVLTLEQSRAVFAACRDYRDNEDAAYQVDCRDALPAFAVQLFAGLRPQETTRLKWSHIDFEKGHIAVPASVSKTGTARYVDLEPALRAWLEPFRGKDTGALVPSNWGRKRRQVRTVLKLPEDGQKGSVFRHTYASMWLAAFGDMNALLLRMGHTTQRTTLEHYQRAVIKSDALEFWKIAPEGVEIDLVGVIAA